MNLLNKTKEYKWNYLALIFPLLLLFMLYATGSFLLLLNIKMGFHYFLISFFITSIFIFLLNKKDFFKIITVSILITVLSLLLMTFIYDRSWDGNAYHKLCTGLIKEGWNPIYETITSAIDRLGYFNSKEVASSNFYDGYPKASYLIAAEIYSFTGNIETGKVFNLLTLISAFTIVYKTSSERFHFSHKTNFLIAFSLCCTPVVFGQMFTYMNDAFLHLLFFIVCSEFFYIYYEDINNCKLDYFIIIISIILAVNLKYSAMILFFIPCLIYLIFIYINKKEQFISVILLFFSIVFLSLIVFGETSYVHNLKFYRNPFYTIIGTGKEDVYSPSIPLYYRGIPNIFRLGFSIFSPVTNDRELNQLTLKIPFTFMKDSKGEILLGYDTCLAGWGFLYSGLFILSIILFIYRLFTKKLDKLNMAFIILLCSSFLPALFLNCLNNARYWPFMFFNPLYIILCINLDKAIENKRNMLIYRVLIVLICLNSTIILPGNFLLVKNTIEQKNNYKKLKKEDNYNNIWINQPGLLFNLHDNNIYISPKIGNIVNGEIVVNSYNAQILRENN